MPLNFTLLKIYYETNDNFVPSDKKQTTIQRPFEYFISADLLHVLIYHILGNRF